MKPISRTLARQEARALGLRHYRTGLPCARGHVALRLTSDASCILCKRECNNRRVKAKTLDRTPNLLSVRWTAERDAELARLLGTHSLAKAAEIMGITKNAAVGRAYRLGMARGRTRHADNQRGWPRVTGEFNPGGTFQDVTTTDGGRFFPPVVYGNRTLAGTTLGSLVRDGEAG